MSLLDLRLAATVTMGRSEDEFLAMTPRILFAEMERHAEERVAERRHWNVRAGTLTAAVYNAGGVKRDGGGGWRASDFFDVGEAETVRPAQTPEQMKAVAQMWGAVFSNLPRSKA